MTTTAQSILDGLQKAMLLRVERGNRPKRRHLVVDASGQPVFRTVRDKLGNIIRIYRSSEHVDADRRKNYTGADLREITAQKGVGRPPMLLGWAKAPVGAVENVTQAITTSFPMSLAIQAYGSQRAAAKALGLNLSTFQRRLAKERAAV